MGELEKGNAFSVFESRFHTASTTRGAVSRLANTKTLASRNMHQLTGDENYACPKSSSPN